MWAFVRLLIWLLLAVGLGIYLRNTEGMVIFLTSETRRTMTLPVFWCLVALGFIGIYVLIRLISFLMNMRRTFGKWYASRALSKENHLLLSGFLSIFKPNEDKALLDVFERSVDKRTQAMTALVIARSAHLVNNLEKRDHYFKQAMQLDPELAPIGDELQLTWALEAKNLEVARSCLTRLLHTKNAAKNDLFKCYELDVAILSGELGTDHIAQIIRELAHKKLIALEQANALLEESLLQYLATCDDEQWLKRWNKLHVNEQRLPRLALAANQFLVQRQLFSDASKVLMKALEVAYRKDLLDAFVHAPESELKTRMKFIQQYMKQNPDEPLLINALAKLCMLSGLWGQAESLLLKSLALKDQMYTHELLASLYDHTGELNKAVEHWRKSSEMHTHITVFDENQVLKPADKTADPSGQPDQKSASYIHESFLASKDNPIDIHVEEETK